METAPRPPRVAAPRALTLPALDLRSRIVPVGVTDDGTTREYRVVAREQWPKEEVPLDRLFDRGGEHRIVLIMCGGVFDQGSGDYEDNIAVTAVPA